MNTTNKESKHDKWLRLSKSRKLKIAEQLRLIVNLNNKSNYEYSEEETEELFNELETMVSRAEELYKRDTKTFILGE